MHRPFWLRALIAVWGLWFTTSVVEPAGLFACAMHGLAVPAHAGGDASTTAQAMASDHGMHGAQRTAASAAAVPAPHSAGAVAIDAAPAPREHQHHDCCTCLGNCCQSAPVATPSTAITLAPLAECDNAVAAIAIATRGVERRPFALPFAIGPPALS
jgi:hypothetical protein